MRPTTRTCCWIRSSAARSGSRTTAACSGARTAAGPGTSSWAGDDRSGEHRGTLRRRGAGTLFRLRRQRNDSSASTAGDLGRSGRRLRRLRLLVRRRRKERSGDAVPAAAPKQLRLREHHHESRSRPSIPIPSAGTQKIYVPSTRKLVPGDATATPPVPPKLVPYASSGLVLRGLRPLIRTLATELPPADGDYVFIHQDLQGKSTLLRTLAISSIANVDDWDDPAKAMPIGPQLPMSVDIVQGAGGHANPTFYVGDPSGTVYKLNAAGSKWDKIVTGALRWFVDPFDPDTLYVLDYGGVKVSLMAARASSRTSGSTTSPPRAASSRSTDR